MDSGGLWRYLYVWALTNLKDRPTPSVSVLLLVLVLVLESIHSRSGLRLKNNKTRKMANEPEWAVDLRLAAWLVDVGTLALTGWASLT